MKKIAAILLFIFTLVQAGPAVASLFSPSVSMFIADEEKGEEKSSEEKKSSKKDFTIYTQQVTEFNEQVITAVHLAEKVHPAPCIEKVSPPPNGC